MRQYSYCLDQTKQYIAIAFFNMAALNLLIFSDFYFEFWPMKLLQHLVTSVSVIISLFTSPLRVSENFHR